MNKNQKTIRIIYYSLLILLFLFLAIWFGKELFV